MTVFFIMLRKYALNDEVRVSAHSFRKFHKTALEGAGVPAEWVLLLEGKSASVYSRPQDGPELLEAYARAYDVLRIHPHGKLAEEVHDLRKRLDTQNGQLAEVESLKASVGRLGDMLNILMTNYIMDGKDEANKTEVSERATKLGKLLNKELEEKGYPE